MVLICVNSEFEGGFRSADGYHVFHFIYIVCSVISKTETIYNRNRNLFAGEGYGKLKSRFERKLSNFDWHVRFGAPEEIKMAT